MPIDAHDGGAPAGINLVLSIALPASAAMQANPAGALATASVTQTPVPFSLANPTELGQSIVTALLGHAATDADQRARFKGHPFFDNQGVQYSSPTLPAPVLAFINANVGRFSVDPSALNHMEQDYQPTGGLQVPMLMLSDSRDPVVPDSTGINPLLPLRLRSVRLPRPARHQPLRSLRVYSARAGDRLRRSRQVGRIWTQTRTVTFNRGTAQLSGRNDYCDNVAWFPAVHLLS